MAALVAGTALTAVPYNVLADEVIMEWREENGVKYWYENGVRQGVKYREDGSIDASYRGKEIYDPSSNAWYWLDCVQNGAVAKDKDVYQESQADDAGNIGKWVRYDADGHMVKGWSEKDGNRYYFDPVYGTMAKGDADIDGIHYYFNKDTGILESGGQTDDDGRSFNEDGWHKVDGVNYWYENGVRQGVKYREDGSIDASYRGKEIYDPSSNAWYWLDCVQNGAVAKDKDVYQESQADDAGNIGKWVRYDADGHMVKGWNEKDGSRYYFDPVYGTMAKGAVTIDGKRYTFDETTGVFQSESTEVIYSIKWMDGICKALANGVVDESYSGVIDYSPTKYTFVDGRLIKASTLWAGGSSGHHIEESQYDENGKRIKYVIYNSDESVNCWYTFDETDSDGNTTKYTLYNADETIRQWYEREYNNKNVVKSTVYNADGSVARWSEYEYDANGNNIKSKQYNAAGYITYWCESEYNDSGKLTKSVYYNADGSVSSWSENEYYDNRNIKKSSSYRADGSISSISEYDIDGNRVTTYYRADGGVDNISEYNNGYLKKRTQYNENGGINSVSECNEKGQEIKYTRYNADGSISWYDLYERDSNGNMIKLSSYEADGSISFWQVYEYDANGNNIKMTVYRKDGKIGSIYEYEYNSNQKIKSTEYYPDGSLKNVIEYGSNQIKIKESDYSQGGILYSVTEYSATGKKAKVTYYGASDSTGVKPVVNEYDDSEKLIKSTQYNSDGSIDYWYIYEYSENSMTQTEFRADGTPRDEWVYEYDASGRTVKSSNYSYYSDGTRHLGFWTEYAYDAVGNEIKHTTYWVEYNTYYYYDEKDSAGNIVKRVHCRLSDGSLYYCEEYNTDGNVGKELRYDEAGNLDKWTIYTYDSQGRKKKATTYKVDGSLYSITTYTYNGNNSSSSTRYY